VGLPCEESHSEHFYKKPSRDPGHWQTWSLWKTCIQLTLRFAALSYPLK
jgi:hypothetical protein